MLILATIVTCALVGADVAMAQTPPAAPASQEDVAKQLSNPIANLVSLPLQFNWEEGVGPDEDLRFILNFQPVVPFSLNESWNLVGRLILPFIAQPALARRVSTSGTGDICAVRVPLADRIEARGLGRRPGLRAADDH